MSKPKVTGVIDCRICGAPNEFALDNGGLYDAVFNAEAERWREGVQAPVLDAKYGEGFRACLRELLEIAPNLMTELGVEVIWAGASEGGWEDMRPMLRKRTYRDVLNDHNAREEP